MPKLPNKSIKGASFKKWVIESLDAIIDYLDSARYLQGAPGVTVERKPSGIVIGLEKQAPQTASVSGGTAAYSGLTATVSGGTATVNVSGVNPLEIVAGANMNITGGTNGEVIFDANVSSDFPIWGDYSILPLSETWSGTDLEPIVLRESGYLQISASASFLLDGNNSFVEHIYNAVFVDGVSVWEYDRTCSFTGATSSISGLEFNDTNTQTVMIPVHSGSTVTASSTDQSIDLNLYYLNV